MWAQFSKLDSFDLPYPVVRIYLQDTTEQNILFVLTEKKNIEGESIWPEVDERYNWFSYKDVGHGELEVDDFFLYSYPQHKLTAIGKNELILAAGSQFFYTVKLYRSTDSVLISQYIRNKGKFTRKKFFYANFENGKSWLDLVQDRPVIGSSRREAYPFPTYAMYKLEDSIQTYVSNIHPLPDGTFMLVDFNNTNNIARLVSFNYNGGISNQLVLKQPVPPSRWSCEDWFKIGKDHLLGYIRYDEAEFYMQRYDSKGELIWRTVLKGYRPSINFLPAKNEILTLEYHYQLIVPPSLEVHSADSGKLVKNILLEDYFTQSKQDSLAGGFNEIVMFEIILSPEKDMGYFLVERHGEHDRQQVILFRYNGNTLSALQLECKNGQYVSILPIRDQRVMVAIDNHVSIYGGD